MSIQEPYVNPFAAREGSILGSGLAAMQERQTPPDPHTRFPFREVAIPGPSLSDLFPPASAPADDPVNSPPHYRQGGVECIDAIRAALTEEEFRGYCKGNALKYIWRERHKGGAESLAKAEWYLKKLVGNK